MCFKIEDWYVMKLVQNKLSFDANRRVAFKEKSSVSTFR